LKEKIVPVNKFIWIAFFVLSFFMSFGVIQNGQFISLYVPEVEAQEESRPVSKKDLEKQLRKLTSRKLTKVQDGTKFFTSLGPKVEYAVPQILQAYDEQESRQARFSIMLALMEIAPQNPEIQTRLINGLTNLDENQEVLFSLDQLSEVEPTNERIIDALVDVVIRDEGKVGSAAEGILANLYQSDPIVLDKVLLHFEKNPKNFSPFFGKIGDDGAAGVPVMISYLEKAFARYDEFILTPVKIEGTEEFYLPRSKYFHDLGSVIFNLAKIGPAGLEAVEIIKKYAKANLPTSEFSYPVVLNEVNAEFLVTFGLVQFIGAFYGHDADFTNLVDELIPEAKQEISTMLAVSLLEEPKEKQQLFIGVLNASLKRDSGVKGYFLLQALANFGPWLPEYSSILQTFMGEDMNILQQDLLYAETNEGRKSAISVPLFQNLNESKFLLNENTPDLLFARNEPDLEIRRTVLLKRVQSVNWLTRISAIQAFSVAGFKDQKLIRIITSQWELNMLPGNLAIIRTLAMIGSEENGAVEFLENIDTENKAFKDEAERALQDIALRKIGG